jgi:hypothetical protein
VNKADALARLHQYEQDNADLHPVTRRMLAIYLLASLRAPRDLVDELYGRKSNSPWRDTSARWWYVLATSKVARLWEGLREAAHAHGTMYATDRWLRDRLTPWELELVEKRSGKRLTHGRKVRGESSGVWFKAGTWFRNSPWTQIMVLNQHLDRPFELKYQHKLGKGGQRLVELELQDLVDLDKVSVPKAKWTSVEYVRDRIGELLGRPKMPLPTAAWFFQTQIPVPNGVITKHAVRTDDLGHKRMKDNTRRLWRGWT